MGNARKGQTVILSDGSPGIVTDVGEDGAYSGVILTGAPFAVAAPEPEPEPEPEPAEPELVDSDTETSLDLSSDNDAAPTSETWPTTAHKEGE